MSEPTYRIEVESRPADNPHMRFCANIHRVVDGSYVTCEFGATYDGAVNGALTEIHRRANTSIVGEYWADENGHRADPPATPEPQSLRA